MAFSGIVLICYFFFLGFNFSSLYAIIVVEEPLPENWTLVYDNYYDNKLFCKFGTLQELSQANGYIEPKCASKYKDIKSVRPDGQQLSPFLKFESPQGVSLQCDADIPNGKLLRCDYKPPYVGTQCSYNCNAGYSVTSTNVTCRLMKPFENVTAKWWPSDPCQLNEITDPLVIVSQPNVLMIVLIVGLCVLVAIAAIFVTYLLYKWKSAGRHRTIQISNEVGIAELPLRYPDSFNHWTNITMLNNNNDKFPNGDHFYLDDEKKEPVNKMESISELNVSLPLIKKGLEDDNIPEDDFELEVSKLLRTDTDIVNNLKYVEQPRVLQKSFETPLMLETIQRTESEYMYKAEGCSENVNVLFKGQTLRYRAKLRGELEFIEGRPLDKTLAGYVRENWKKLNFASENDVKVNEHSYLQRTDEKVSDYFLQIMSQHGITVGEMLEYFNGTKANDVINVVLEAHQNCSFCNKFRR